MDQRFNWRLPRILRRWILRSRPGVVLLAGYGLYMLLGWALLALPIASDNGLAPMDSLFLAVSAVSTTGLVTVDPGSSLTPLGEGMLLVLFQVGGLGYLTIGSFAMLAINDRLGPVRTRVTRFAFSMPRDARVAPFIRTVVLFALTCETLGTLSLWPLFALEGVEAPFWKALFHAVSAFCTAGFSLFPDSLEGFRGSLGVNLVISALSLAGAMGFLVAWDGWLRLTQPGYRIGFTTRVILGATALMIVVGTVLTGFADAGLAKLPFAERWLAASFQAMSAATTVGFNSYPIGALSLAPLLGLIVLMSIGASPSGTGGGLKTTTVASMIGIIRSVTHQRPDVRFLGRRIPDRRASMAAASCGYFAVMLAIALGLLALSDAQLGFDALVFEAVSAVGTVGLSTGVTAELSSTGKIVVMILMTAGRVGILAFAIATALPERNSATYEDDELLL
ncbi:MAG: potassium transporter TrkG [Pseudomonadales bacterium]|nr:potassium transporter TrkG [Pseudomonadales bacterium]